MATMERERDISNEALKTATDAVRAERVGDLRVALGLYKSAAEDLIKAATAEKEPGRRGALRKAAGDVLTSAERVKGNLESVLVEERLQKMQIAASQKSAPPPPPTTRPLSISQASIPRYSSSSSGDQSNSGQSTPMGNDNSAMRQILSATGDGVMSLARKALQLNEEYQIHQKVGEGLKAGVGKVRELDQQYDFKGKAESAAKGAVELNEKHQITDKVGEVLLAAGKAVMTGLSFARETDEKYRIHQTVGEGIRTGYQKAREFNDEHDVTGRIASGAKSLFQSAKEMDERYQIKENIGSAAMSGLSALASTAKRASASLDEKRSEIDGRRGNQ